MPHPTKIALAAKLAQIQETWSPHLVGSVNDCAIKLVKLRGEFVWHAHPDTDDFFLVLKGHLTIQLRDRNIELAAGEMFVVERGVEHRPVADEEAHILLIEPRGTPNTGDVATAAPRVVI